MIEQTLTLVTPVLGAQTDTPILEPQANNSALCPIDSRYRHVLRILMVIQWVPLVLGSAIIDALFIAPSLGSYGLLAGPIAFIGLLAVIFLPTRRYARWGYVLGKDMLRTAHGYVFRIDTIVPFVRVQHIDVEQGPIERLFGLARLVMHTSGTHNSMISLPGLTTSDASTMRDLIRNHIQSDD